MSQISVIRLLRTQNPGVVYDVIEDELVHRNPARGKRMPVAWPSQRAGLSRWMSLPRLDAAPAQDGPLRPSQPADARQGTESTVA
jgi:hypothetical protein